MNLLTKSFDDNKKTKKINKNSNKQTVNLGTDASKSRIKHSDASRLYQELTSIVNFNNNIKNSPIEKSPTFQERKVSPIYIDVRIKSTIFRQIKQKDSNKQILGVASNFNSGFKLQKKYRISAKLKRRKKKKTNTRQYAHQHTIT